MKFKKIGAGLIGILMLGSSLADNIATVNGVGIPRADFNLLLNEVRMKGAMPFNSEEAIKTLIRNEVVLQKGKELEVDKRPEIKKQIELFKKQLIINSTLEHLAANIKISEAEYQKAYTEVKKDFPTTEYKASHILLASEAAARDIIKKLDAGKDFAVLARKHSIGSSGSTGGGLNWFNPDLMDPDFVKGLKRLSKGEYSKSPVKSQFGYHVILLTGERSFEPPAMEDMKPQLQNVLLTPKLIDAVDKLVAEAKVVRY